MLGTKTRKISIITETILFLCIVFVTISLLDKLEIIDYEKILQDDTSLALSTYDTKEKIKQENKYYIKDIKEKYNIKVMYGKDTNNFVSEVNGIVQTNENIVNNNLKIIYDALEKYPKDIFDIFKSKGYTMYIMLVDSFTNDNLALASRNSLNDVRIYVSNTEKLERAFHHEMFHVLEYFMSDNHKYLYASWYRLNPLDFSYEENINDLTSDYVLYSSIKNSDNLTNYENTYFVTKYAKTQDKEDRAETFAEMMILEKNESYFSEGTHLYKKAKAISDSLKQYLTDESFYFSKYINI